MSKPSILTILSLIQRAPSMYLGGGSHGNQLHALQAVMTGYGLALRQHGVGNDDLRVIGQLEDFLRERAGADNLTGMFCSPRLRRPIALQQRAACRTARRRKI